MKSVVAGQVPDLLLPMMSREETGRVPYLLSHMPLTKSEVEALTKSEKAVLRRLFRPLLALRADLQRHAVPKGGEPTALVSFAALSVCCFLKLVAGVDPEPNEERALAEKLWPPIQRWLKSIGKKRFRKPKGAPTLLDPVEDELQLFVCVYPLLLEFFQEPGWTAHPPEELVGAINWLIQFCRVDLRLSQDQLTEVLDRYKGASPNELAKAILMSLLGKGTMDLMNRLVQTYAPLRLEGSPQKLEHSKRRPPDHVLSR